MKGKMFKVLSPIPKKDGGTFWQRCGTGFENKDGSMNLYLDVFPKNFQLYVKEFDEDELVNRDGRRTNHATGAPELPVITPAAAPAVDNIPF